MMLIAVLGFAAARGRREMTMVGGCALPGAIQAPAQNDGQDGTVHGEDGPVSPHTNVFKDGFWSVGCRLDAMLTEGDKYGDEAQSYDVGRSVNTSIVRYDEILDRENQKDMTPQVCFDFCRTMPDMSFFGLVHGRDCYCMHYYRDAAGGSGVCDLPCEGDTGSICGGEHKSSIYQMHSCEGGLAQDLDDTKADVETVQTAVGDAYGATSDVAQAMQASGDALEALGEATASPLAQEAKVVAGPLTRAAEDLSTLEAEMGQALSESAAAADVTTFDGRKEAEASLARMSDLLDASDEALPAAKSWVDRTQPTFEAQEDFENTFVPILRQVESDLESRQSVCTGELTGTPMVGLSYDECTMACDALAPKSSEDHCIAVQYFELPTEAPLCFMYKELTELTVFNCDYEGDGAVEVAQPEKGESPPEKFLEIARKVRKHKKHHDKHKHHKHAAKKHVRKHKVVEAVQHKHERALYTHPAAKYFLSAFHAEHKRAEAGKAGPATFCGIRYSSTYGVTPTFFDGMTKLDRCFAA